MSKSFVTMEREVCPVCGDEHDTGNLLMDRRLKARFEKHTTTGWGLCEEHQLLYKQGFVALVEIDPDKSNAASKDTIDMEDAYRLGRLAHIKRDIWEEMTGLDTKDHPVVYVDSQVIDYLQEIAPQGDHAVN